MIFTQFSSTRPRTLRILSCRIRSARSFFVFSLLSKNHYEALGVSPNATQADIKAAYYKLSMLYHPDRNETPEASQSFRKITEAYEIIGNFKLRKMYDKGLLGHTADESSKRTYTDFHTSSSNFRNKPTHYSRSSAYNFDEWTQLHYGNTFEKRNAAKMEYDYKSSSSGEKGAGRHENAAYAVLIATVFWFIVFNSIFSSSFDNPKNVPPKKQ